MVEDFEHCYRAVQSRDPRFDGWFVTAVTTTGIYCRPSCPARTPAPANVRFYPSAAAAQQAGFRACLRCRPDAAPGSPEWNVRADAVGRAMRLIADGVVDREGVGGLAARLGYGTRHLHRLLVDEVGAGPLALARAQRTQTARLLIETTALSMSDIAFAAGFSSVRQFNDTVRAALGTTPSALRGFPARARPGTVTHSGGPTVVTLRLASRTPLAASPLLAFLGARAVPGVERAGGGRFARSLRLPHGEATVTFDPAADHVTCRLALGDLRDLTAAVARCRRLLDLDADPVAVDGALGEDPLLGALVRAVPGRRVPGAVDGFELAVRAVVGQQVSVAHARRLLGRLVETAGPRLGLAAAPDLDPPTALFPSPEELACALGAMTWLPRARIDALGALARAVAEGAIALDPGADPQEATTRLRSMKGFGPWTASYVAMRALGDPDAFVAGDAGVRRALGRLGAPTSARRAHEVAERWRPWRAYATVHLWALAADGAERPPSSQQEAA